MKMIALFCLLAGSRGYAAEVLTLKAAVEKAKTYSPDLKSARSQYESAKAKSWLAITPYEPTFAVTYNDMPTAFHTANPASTVYTISQQIGFPGKAIVNHRALRHAADGVRSQAEALELQIATNVKTAYLNLAQAKENQKLNEEQRQAFERILAIAKRRYASGAIPQVDLLNAQVSLYSNANDTSDLKMAEVNALAQLNVLMGVSAEQEQTLETLKAAKFPIPTLQNARDKMLANRHELQAARDALMAAEESLTFTRMQLLPDVQLSAGMTHYNEPTATPWNTANASLTTTYLFGAQISVPLFGLFNERQVIVGAARDRAAAQANLDVALNQSLISLKSTLENLKAGAFRMQNSEQHLMPLSEQALSLALINYSAGKIDFQTLADTASSRRNIRRDYFSTVVNYLTTYATLGQLMGEEL